MNCGAIWRDWLGSASRSMQSSRLGLNAWNRRRALARMQWCGCWQALLVLVSRQRICWCRRSCRETFEIDGPWLVTPASPGRPTRAGSNDVRRAWRRRAMHACGAASFSWRGASCASRRKAHWGNSRSEMVGKVRFEARIQELVENIPDMAVLVESLLIVRRALREQIVILHRRLLAIVR